jgi:hypothetical protein
VDKIELFETNQHGNGSENREHSKGFRNRFDHRSYGTTIHSPAAGRVIYSEEATTIIIIALLVGHSGRPAITLKIKQGGVFPPGVRRHQRRSSQAASGRATNFWARCKATKIFTYK